MEQRTPIYLDFEAGEIKQFDEFDVLPNSVVQLPIGYVLSNTTNTNPYDDLGYGNWVLLGTVVIGATTVYYFENQLA